MYSEDPFSKKEGGCLGYITRDEVTDEFKDIVFQMEKGKISKPFKTIYGYHIAKVTDINPRHVLPLKDVKQKIIKTLKSNKARENVFREAKRIQVELRKNPEKFEQITESKGLKAIKTGFFSIRDVKEPLNKDIIEQSLYMDKDKISNPIKSNENYIVFKLLDKKPAYIPKLEEIKQKVIKEYKNEKSKELLRKKAGEIKKALSSKNLKTLAIKENLKLKQTPYFNRINKTYSIPCLKDNVFSLKKNEGDFCIFDDIAYVYQLKKRKAIDKTEYNELKDKVKESLEQKEREKAIQDFLKQLKAKAKIKINEKALSQWT
jgi:peptidyl-prolyl cis-trans isomerase D